MIHDMFTVVKGKDGAPAITMAKTSAGKDVANFTVSKSNGKGKDGNWNPCTFYKICAFGYQAMDASRLEEKDQVYIVGRLVREFWKDREGADRFTDKIYADEIYKLERKQKTQTETTYKSMKRVDAPSDADFEASMITAEEVARIDEASGNVPF